MSDTRLEAEIHEIERTLRGYGVLTRDRLAEICGGGRWREPLLSTALAVAVERGTVVRVSDELYESAD